MADNDQWADVTEETPAKPKKKMSGCLLATLILGGLGVIVCLGCCGVVAYFVPGFIPVEVRTAEGAGDVGKRILDLQVPPDFTPVYGSTVDNMFMAHRAAKYEQKEGKGTLQLVQFIAKFDEQGQVSNGNGPLPVLSPNHQDILQQVNYTNVAQRDILIAGQNVSATFGEGTDQFGKAVHTVSATLNVPKGKVAIRLRVDDEIWDEDAVVKMLEEAKLPQ